MKFVRSLLPLLFLFTAIGASAQDTREPRVPKSVMSIGASSVRAASHSPTCTESPVPPGKPRDEYYVVNCAENMDVYIFNDESPIIIDIPFTRAIGKIADLKKNKLIGDTLTIDIMAYDIDDVVDPETGFAAERDKVVFNGRFLGYLEGKNNEWSLTQFTIPIEWVRFPTFTNNPVQPVENRLTVEIDTANEYPVWAVQIDYVTASYTATRPVLLVHGILTQGSTWRRKLQYAGFQPRFQHPRTWEEENNYLGVPTIAMDLPLHGTQDIEGNAAKIGQYVQLLQQRTGAQKVIIQAHSKGGIDSRHYVENHDTVERLWMMGSSHEGSPIADVIDYLLKKLGIQSFIANLVPIQEILTSKYMKNYNATHGHNSNVRYKAFCGRYQPHIGTTWWEYLLMGIVGEGDTIVPVDSCLALPYASPGWVKTWGNNRASQHTSLCASLSIHYFAFEHLQIKGPFSSSLPGLISTMDVGRIGTDTEGDEPGLIPLESGINPPTSVQPPTPTELAPPSIGRLTLGQTQTFPIAVDEPGKNAFTLMSAGGDVQLNLISPTGIRYTPSSTFPPNAGYDESEFFSAPMAVYHFEATETGLWTGEVVANTITHESGQAEYAFRLMMAEPTSKTSVDMVHETVRLNESLHPRVTVKRNNVPMLGLTVKADVFRGPTQVGTITLFDNGTSGDLVPGDGTYTGTFAGTTAHGRYDFLIDVSDQRVGAIPFSRSGMTQATVTASLSTIVGPFDDAAYDVDDDDGLDVIDVSGHVQIDRPGTYRAYGELKASNGVVVAATSQVINSGGAGTGLFHLKFTTSDIYTLQLSGPYSVSFKLAEETATSIGVIHELPNAHTTRAYQYYRFQPPPPAALENTELVTASVQTVYGGTVSPAATLTSNGQPLSGKKINFSINHASLGTAITDANGVARLVDAKVPMYYAAKTHTFTAAFGGDPIYAASNAVKTITVFKTEQVINWENPGDIVPGTPLGETELNATITVPTGGQPGGELVYDPPAETVLEEGTHTLTVTALTNAYYQEASKTVQIRVGRPLATVNWSTPAPITYGTALTSAQLNATSPSSGQYFYSPPAGTKLNAGTHTLYVTFYPSGFGQAPVTKTVNLVVNKATQTITWANPAPINFGAALTSAQLNATTNGGGAITYNPVAGTVLDAGTHTLTANAAATANYNAATATVPLTVNAVGITLAWLQPAPITYGTPLAETQLSATASVAGTFAYSPVAGTVLPAGTHTLNVTFTPANNNHTPKSASVSLTVNKAATAVTWSAPAPIVYGTPLGTSQQNATANAAGTFAYTPAAGTILNAGSGQTLTVVFTPADAQNYNGSSKSVAIEVTKAAQVITWSNPADIVYGAALSATQLNATTNGGGALTYSPAAGTVLNAGTHTLSVSAAATANYNAATKSVSLNVAKAAQTITWSNPAAIVFGTPLSATQLDATTDGGGALTYSPAAGTLLNAGTHTLTASAAATANFNAATKSVSIQVAKAAQVIAWSNPAGMVYGTPLSATQLNAMTNGGGALTYSPAAGTILDAGTHVLSVTAAETANFTAAAKSVNVSVAKAATTIVWNNPADIVYGTPLGNTQLDATTNSGATLTYSPEAGTLLDTGTHTLSVTAAETANYSGATKSVSLVVKKAMPILTWPVPAPITYGTALGAAQLNATANVAGTFAYTPAAGALLNAGPAQPLLATFTPADASNYENATASTTIDVLKAAQSITWAAPAGIVYGTPLSATQLNATTNGGGALTYSPAAGTILNAGTHTLAVTASETANYKSAAHSVNLVVIKAAATITWSNPADIVYGNALTSTQLNATTDSGGALTYSPAGGTILNAGTHTLSVTSAETANYFAASKSVSLVVRKATQSISWAAPAPIIYGTPLSNAQLDATVSVVGPSAAGAISYTPAAGTVLQAGNEVLTVNVAETANYQPATASVTLTIRRATPVVTWSAPAGIVYGTPLGATQLNATANVAGSFAYTPAAGTILNAGNGHALQAVFTPADTRNYENVTQSTSIDVAKAKQTLAWSAPSPIVYGTPLRAAQLNATVTVVGPASAGSLVYAPPAGIVLDAGRHTLKVSALETSNYLPASAEVSIDVTRAPLTVTVAPRSKVYGAPLPALGGTITGVVNNDPIEPSYATAATQSSPAGTYPITASLVDPRGRAVNYDVTITPSTLTVTRAALTITANSVSSQYSDPIPQLTATFTGLVLGETPAVLAGTLSLQTTATKDSAPGVYPIVASGLSSPNYDIAFLSGSVTITQEDARVTFVAPAAFPATGATTTVVLATTVRDVSATADAAGDTNAGAILKATVTFVDRSTGATLCTAPLGLFSSDTRIATATCTFNGAIGQYTVGTRVGGHYVRDAASDDVVVTVAAPTTDDVTGGGWITLANPAGTHSADAGTRGNLNVNLAYDKNGALKGKFTFAFSRNGKSYEISGDNAGLLIRRTAEGGVATIVGNAVLRDTTSNVVVDPSAVLVATLADRGEPGTTDGATVLLMAKNGGVLFASKWDGTQPVEELLRGGNLVVHEGK